jgi:hypothetical protein
MQFEHRLMSPQHKITHYWDRTRRETHTAIVVALVAWPAATPRHPARKHTTSRPCRRSGAAGGPTIPLLAITMAEAGKTQTTDTLLAQSCSICSAIN